LTEKGYFMKKFLEAVFKISRSMEFVGGLALSFIIFLTTADVFLRALGRPIPGVYEIVAIGGGAIVGFIMPMTSWGRKHVYVNFAIKALPPRIKTAFDVTTRCIGIGLFLLIGWNLMKLGTEFGATGQVSITLQIPLYPIAHGLGACFFVLSIVLFCDLIKIFGGNYE
jgi:TRAP-type C4-dicarboxylate transport system permease small subunit